MLKIGKERILERLNDYSKDALRRGSEICIENGHFEVTVGHLLLALLEQQGSDTSKLLTAFDLMPERLVAKVRKSLETVRRGAQDLPEFSTLLLELFQDALMLSTAEFGEDDIRTGTIFAAIAQNPDKYCHFYVFSEFEKVDDRALVSGFRELTRGSMEGPTDLASPAGQQGDSPATVPQTESLLSKYCRNITDEAKDGKIDPVFCRDIEIGMMTDVLCRRRKNNPILVGEPGVGKTAIAEGLALKIVEDDVPEALRGAIIWEFDMGSLQAGASVKGEFERRLKGVLDEVLGATEKIILFIDEAHTLIGGGNQAGGSDAANLLKPALARGELRTIAATTWSEYKKYFEKDPALTRRFQLIKVDEPSPPDCVTILRGLRAKYETQHNVYISDAALHAAAELSARYLTGRQLPDKALDTLDTASVRVAAGQSAQPRSLGILRKRVQMLEQEKFDAERDVKMGADGALSELGHIDAAIDRAQSEMAALETRWKNEKTKVDRVVELRGILAESDDEHPEAFAELQGLLNELREARKLDAALVEFEVGEQIIAEVISDWTGVPANAMSDDDADKLLGLGDTLKASIKGQDDAIDIIHARLKAARLDFIRPTTPRGVFLLVGPSGVGKTETAEQVAKTLFGGTQFLTVINMSEYQEKHTVSRLIGSPPGYVGYGEGGVLTEAIRKMPYSVVLLDEVEKAHPDVMNIFYQGFDKGVLNDGEGREIDCKNVVFFMTSNLGTQALMENRETVATASPEALEKALRPHLLEHFKPALLARMRVLCYKPLESETLRDIIDLKFAQLEARLGETRALEFSWDDGVSDLVAELSGHSENGARMVEQVIDLWILPQIADETLNRIAQHRDLTGLEVSAADGGFLLSFLPPDPEQEMSPTSENASDCSNIEETEAV